MTPTLTGSPDGGQPMSSSTSLAPAAELLAPTGAPAAAKWHRRRTRTDRPFPVALVVAACLAVHLLAAALAYRDLAADLYTLFEASPRLLVLERGLTRLTAVTVFLPPVIPAALIVVVALWLGAARRIAGTSRWLALALVPIAVDSVLRAAGVLIAPPPANMGELLDLPSRFSLGPRLLLDLAEVQLPAGLGYWAVVATVPAAVSAWCVARALLAAEEGERPATARRRRRGADRLAAVQVGVAVVGTWIALAFAGQVALPWAAQLFLRLFG